MGISTKAITKEETTLSRIIEIILTELIKRRDIELLNNTTSVIEYTTIYGDEKITNREKISIDNYNLNIKRLQRDEINKLLKDINIFEEKFREFKKSDKEKKISWVNASIDIMYKGEYRNIHISNASNETMKQYFDEEEALRNNNFKTENYEDKEKYILSLGFYGDSEEILTNIINKIEGGGFVQKDDCNTDFYFVNGVEKNINVNNNYEEEKSFKENLIKSTKIKFNF